MPNLREWLADVGLDKYAQTFAEQEIDFDLLPLLTEADVKELGLPIGPRRKLLAAIAALRGEPNQRQRSEAERRQLTVMFVDLAASTSLALRLDPEAMRDVLRAFHDAVTDEICRLGYVAKLMGDGVLAYFGWPRAHEDDARRAVSAALAITEAVGRLGGPEGEQLACRIGIATGMVVVGELIGEGAAQEHTVVGPTPNLAARLQEIAGPGEIVIAEMTRRLLGSSFASQSIGQRVLKGYADPVPVFRIVPDGRCESGAVILQRDDDRPLIGRNAELGVLERAWADAKSGLGRTVLLSGEAGLGKSHLIRELENAVAADRRVARHVFQCSSLHRDNPFWPVLQGFAPATAVAKRIADLSDGADRVRMRREIVEAIAAQLATTTRASLPFIVFEDVQWADRATIALIRRLVAVETPMLLIVTCRPEAEIQLGAEANPMRVALSRLDPGAARALVASVAGDRRLSAGLANDILRRSDGIPLYIEEMTRAVLEAEPTNTPVLVPATLRDSLIARLDVSTAVKTTAQIAACIGREFQERLLFQIADVAREELREGLAGLLEAGLVLATGPGRFGFKHALVSEIAYESLLTPRRQRLHLAIAEALEAMPGKVAEREPESLGHHWFAAGDLVRAELYWLRSRHRIAHWQDQLDALEHYLETGVAEVIPFPSTPGSIKLH